VVAEKSHLEHHLATKHKNKDVEICEHCCPHWIFLG